MVVRFLREVVTNWRVLRLTSHAARMDSLSKTWPYAGNSEYPTVLVIFGWQ